MSNYVPPTTPIGGGPQPFPPQQSYPPAPPQNKSKVWIWLLAGCGTFVLFGVIAVVLGGYFVWNKAKQAGLDPALLERNPSLAVAKMFVATSPDVELVSSDDSKGTLVIRDKKTGKILTLDVDQAEKGKIVFRGEDGEEMTIDSNNQRGLASIKVKSKEGTATFGAGAGTANLPDWLPSYPGAKDQANFFSSQSDESRGGTFSFTTDDSIDQVVRFYDNALKDAGLKVETHSLQMDGKVTLRTVNGADQQKKRTAAIQVTEADGKTQATVVFSSQ